jgi:hypothetical protein
MAPNLCHEARIGEIALKRLVNDDSAFGVAQPCSLGAPHLLSGMLGKILPQGSIAKMKMRAICNCWWDGWGLVSLENNMRKMGSFIDPKLRRNQYALANRLSQRKNCMVSHR